MPEIQFLDEPRIDKDAAPPHGIPCEACGTPVEGLDKFCPACGTPNPRFKQPPIVEAQLAEERHKFFRCQQCGAEVATDPGQLSYTCPFCDSHYVAEYSPDMTGRQLPEFIIGFAVTPEQAQEKFRQWLRDNSWYRPGDLVTAAVADKMKGVYLPFWSFSMLAESSWSAQIGEYWYRTETYTTMENGKLVTKTRQVRETEWWPLSGNHHRYYSGYLVSGSKGLPQSYAERIMPFNLPALKRYEPYFLAGWLSEQYSVPREKALEICQQEFYRREQGNVALHLPGDTHNGLVVQTRFRNVNSDLCLLPVYILSYRYLDRLYRFLVNGQTGKCAGDKPLSWQRIGFAVAAAVALVLLAVLVIIVLLQFSNRGTSGGKERQVARPSENSLAFAVRRGRSAPRPRPP
jgi:Zn finger protein HypA/HybF involved in hydrogenase expression